MEINKAVTYSLLSHVRNSGTLIKGPIDVFVPLVKRCLCFLYRDESISKGQTILEIQSKFKTLYSIDIPLPVLSNILRQIAAEFNTAEHKQFQLFNDNSFIINKYVFYEFDDSVQKSKVEAEELQKLFIQYCEIRNIENKSNSIFDFIDRNKINLSKYLCTTQSKVNEIDFTIEAQFIEYFKKIPTAYELIRNIYLGSIISSFLEYKTDIVKRKVELVLDTNFIISLIDLNTIESTHTCSKLIEIAPHQGYTLTILRDTIEEAQYLLRKKAENLTNVFLQSKINAEDIYNACERKGLGRSDLERIADNLESNLNNLGIQVLPYTQKYVNQARYSNDYKTLQKIRNSEKAALHDATVLEYVREKRGKKKITDFEKVTCWFVNNSNSSENDRYNPSNASTQPEVIKADELLNILWLSNPSITSTVTNDDIVDIGINSIVAFTLNENLPKSSIIKELDDNIHKYAKDIITDDDVILISTRIVNRQLRDIQPINNAAQKEDKSEFIRRLKSEADKQKKQREKEQEKLEKLLSTLQKTVLSAQNSRYNYEQEKSKIQQDSDLFQVTNNKRILELESLISEKDKEKKELENKQRKEKREEFINNEITRWRVASWKWLIVYILVCIFSVIVLFCYFRGDLNMIFAFIGELKNNIVFSILFTLSNLILGGVIITSLVLKYINHSNIKAFKEQIQIPEDFKHID